MLCPEKLKYPTRRVAHMVAVQRMKEHPEVPDLFVYKCWECREWHLTHLPTKHRKPRRQESPIPCPPTRSPTVPPHPRSTPV